MKTGAILINVSRGGLVNEAALSRALADGHLAGAGLDTFAEEPMQRDSPLLEAPNVLLSPHIAHFQSSPLQNCVTRRSTRWRGARRRETPLSGRGISREIDGGGAPYRVLVVTS